MNNHTILHTSFGKFIKLKGSTIIKIGRQEFYKVSHEETIYNNPSGDVIIEYDKLDGLDYIKCSEVRRIQIKDISL